MKLGEFVINQNIGTPTDWALKLGRSIARIVLGNESLTNVRVEIHSIDDEPWPTERPKDGGVGCWCRISSGQDGGCTWLSGDNRQPQVCVLILTAGHWSVGASVQGLLRDLVTAYSPRAEVGR